MSFFDDDNEYDLIPEGEHIATLDDVEINANHENKKTGEKYPLITLTWLLANKRKLWQNLMFKETTKGIVSGAAKGLGVRDEVKANVTDPSDTQQSSEALWQATRKLVNKKFEIKVQNNEYNGKTYQNVYVNNPVDKVVQNFAPQTAKKDVPAFDANEEVPF